MPHEGVNIMRLVNLNALYIDMQQHNADSMVFAAQVKGHPFSCTFAKVIGTLHLFVTALGQNPFTIDIQVTSMKNFECILKLKQDGKILFVLPTSFRIWTL